jgi:transcription antitermination factor NusG
VLKLTDNPPILSPANLSFEETSPPWWVAHTKARAEKQFAWDLHRKEISYFLPMVEKTTFSGGRKRRGMMPLFPSYVFFRGDENQRLTAFHTDRIAQVIEVKDQSMLRDELASLWRAISSGMKLDPYPFAIVGRRCRVRAGVLRNSEGTIIRRDGVDRLVLHVHILGRGAEVEIDPQLLEPLE